jgi:hypothetical protein
MHAIAPFATGIYFNVDKLLKIKKDIEDFKNLEKDFKTKLIEENHLNITDLKFIDSQEDEKFLRTNLFNPDTSKYSKGYFSINVEDPECKKYISMNNGVLSPEITFDFLEKTISLSVSGIGVCRFKIKIESQQHLLDMENLKSYIEKLEEEIKEEIDRFKEKTVNEVTKSLNCILTKDKKYKKFLSKMRTRELEQKEFDFEYWNEKFSWIHKIYCLKDTRFKRVIDKKYNTKDYKKFIEFIQQIPENDTPHFLDTSLFLGWGRSTISTTSTMDNGIVEKITTLIEVSQFF